MKAKQYIVLLALLVATTGCRLIDDDLSVCDNQEDSFLNYLIRYRMNLVMEIHTMIDEDLSSAKEKPVADALKKWSEPIFTGTAHDLDMSFYSLDGTDELRHHSFEIIDATAKSYTLTIPREDYRHLAVVNVLNNSNVKVTGAELAPTACVAQRELDTLPSHPTAVYTARKTMYMPKDTNLSFDVHLYMVSSAVAVVFMDTGKEKLARVEEISLSGTASHFYVNDSIYRFNYSSCIMAEKVNDRCYGMVSFPSRDSLTTAAPMAKRVPSEDKGLWQVRVHIRTLDNKITETLLSVHKPLKAGKIEILKLQIGDDGSVQVIGTTEVGASVTLDWKKGSDYEVITG